MAVSPLEHTLAWLVDDDEDHGCGDLPEEECAAVPVNAARQVTTQTLQKGGDLLVDARTVLSWLIPV
ncbi:MAG: MFS transporter, partial [Nitriliruptoraceae bacterium]